jgi:hypothetical protein
MHEHGRGNDMSNGSSQHGLQLSLEALFARPQPHATPTKQQHHASGMSKAAHALAKPTASHEPDCASTCVAEPLKRAARVSGPSGDGQAMESLRISAQALIASAAREPVALTITDNRRTMLSSRWRQGRRYLRLHKMFLSASPKLLEAIGRYVARGDRLAGKLIDQFIAEHQSAIALADKKPVVLQPVGAVYDLRQIEAELSEHYFAGAVQLPIGWGRAAISQSKRRRRRTLRMGIYLLDEQLIRIHPVLDQRWVPRYFVEWVVFHEMLHHVVPIAEKNGRHEYHSKEFCARERTFARYNDAKKWEEENLSRLIASRGRLSRSDAGG